MEKYGDLKNASFPFLSYITRVMELRYLIKYENLSNAERYKAAK